MSDTTPTESSESSVADAAEFARDRVEEIEDEAADDLAEAEDVNLSLEEAVGQVQPDGEGTPTQK